MLLKKIALLNLEGIKIQPFTKSDNEKEDCYLYDHICEANTEYDIFKIILEDLKSKTLQNNASLKQNQTNIAISEFNLKVNKANFMPTLGFNASYGLNRTENENLINPFGAKLITSDGLNAGLNLTWNIFDGGATKTRVANSKIALENQQILLEQRRVNIENNLKNTWDNYQNQLFVLTAQEQNVISNQNNFDRTQERFKLGQITSLEFRQAQINLINAQTALNNAKFDAKLIELQLLQLSGDILNVKF